MAPDMQNLINQAKAQGLTVYGPENLTTYMWVTDGHRLGYCQHGNPFRPPEFATVHKPCKHAGTGYRVETMAESLSHRPQWAANNGPVIKYKDAAEFIAKYWQPLIQY